MASVQEGWVDANTFAYQAFVHSSPIDLDEVVDYLGEQVAEFGRLTTTNLVYANELARQVRRQRREPKKRKGWLSWLVG